MGGGGLQKYLMADVRERTKQLTVSVATPEWDIARKAGQGEGGRLVLASKGGGVRFMQQK
jgi:hypothetical protein